MAEYIRVISADGKVYKLRVGAVCRNCKSDLTIENWAMGNGQWAAVTYASRVSTSITGRDARVCGHGDNKKTSLG